MTEDSVLLRQFVEARSEAAFAELVRRHLGLVYSIATRQVGGDLNLALDVCQEVFRALATKANRLVDRPTLGGWLYRTTQFEASEMVRSERRRRAREQEAIAMNIDASADQHIDWDLARPLLDEAIAELPDADRDGVCLRFFENRPFAEIGTRLGLTENAARMRIERAVEKLKVGLTRRGITSTSAALGVAIGGQAALATPANLAAMISTTVLTASAATGTSPAAVAGIIMKKSVLIASAAAFVAVGTAIYEFYAAEYAETNAANYRRENDTLRSKLAALRSGSANAGANVAIKAHAIGTTAVTDHSENGGGPAPDSVSGPKTGKTDNKSTAEDSSRKSAVRADREGKSTPAIPEGRLDNWYTAMYQQLHFSPAQISQFKELARENAKRHEELDGIATAQGVKVTDPVMEDFYLQADADLQSKLVAAFGEDATRQIKLFTDQLPLRDVTAQFSNMLSYTSNPLSMPQVDALIAMMWDNMRDASGKISTKAANTVAMRKRAQEIFQPDQYPIFGKWMDQLDQQNGAVARNGTPR